MGTVSTQVMCVWLDEFVAGDKRGLRELLSHVGERCRIVAKQAKSRLPIEHVGIETDDLLQDMHVRLLGRFESLAESIRQVPPQDRLRYFFGCTARVIRDLVCEQSRREAGRRENAAGRGSGASTHLNMNDEGVVEPSPKDYSQVPDRIAMWAEFHEFVSGLPDPLREVADLHWYHGLPHAEVGGMLGIAEVTSRSRWAQVRHRIVQRFPESPFDWRSG